MDLEERVLAAPPNSPRAVYTMGDTFIQRSRPPLAEKEGLHRKGLRTLAGALRRWSHHVRGKLALARMDSAAAVAYADYGVGRPPPLTHLARRIRESELPRTTTVASLAIPGGDNPVVDAPFRLAIRASGGDPRPGRELRGRFQDPAQFVCGRTDVGMTAPDDGSHAWESECRSPSNSAFGGLLPESRLWWPPRMEVVEVVLDRLCRAVAEG